LPTVSRTAPDIAGYENRDVIAQARVTARGHWLALARFRAHNTGQSDDSLNCAYRVVGHLYGAAGVDVAAGGTGTAESVGVVYSARSGRRVQLLCQANGANTFNLSHITLKLVKLA
jgi:hypothetical protein